MPYIRKEYDIHQKEKKKKLYSDSTFCWHGPLDRPIGFFYVTNLTGQQRDLAYSFMWNLNHTED